jgi:prevent-host-death family protein
MKAATKAVPASSVRTKWRDIVAEANASGEVVVTHHDRPEVVVLSMKHYDDLKRRSDPHDALAAYDADLERRMEWFKRPDAADLLLKAFHSTPQEIADAANREAARRRK